MAYQIKLAQFEGPFDLLLHLINKAKINIEDIFVYEITRQYLEYMEEIETVDMDKASDFLNMAANLVYIKSRSLLPSREELNEEGEVVDPQAELIERLREYKVFKELSLKLKEAEKNAESYYYRLPEEIFEEQEFVLEDSDVSALYLALVDMLKRDVKPKFYEEVKITNDAFSIRLQKSYILERLYNERQVYFYSLFENTRTPMEVAVTFIALLELWHIDKIKVMQKEHFKDILIEEKLREGMVS